MVEVGQEFVEAYKVGFQAEGKAEDMGYCQVEKIQLG